MRQYWLMVLLGRIVSAVVALFALTLDARAQQYQDRVGDAYEIQIESVSESSGDGASSSSTSRNTLVERVVAIRDGGVELEFDLPADASEQDRTREWQFPARVFRSPDGALALINVQELEGRAQAFLMALGATPEACGRWIFTWTAIKIECDPQSVLGILESYDLRFTDIRDGALYSESGASAPVPLRQTREGVFVAELHVDPEFVRRQRAESDVVIAELMARPPLTLETALQRRSSEQISGTITTTIEADSAGRVVRRTSVLEIETTSPEGVQHDASTRTATRRFVTQP